MGTGASGQKQADDAASRRGATPTTPRQPSTQIRDQTPTSAEALRDFGRSASEAGIPRSPASSRRWTMPPQRFGPVGLFSTVDLASAKESLRAVAHTDPALAPRLVSPPRASQERLRRASTGSAQQIHEVDRPPLQGGHTHRENVYSTGLMEAVNGRMRLARSPQGAVGPSATEFNDPHRILAAAELFNMITRQFNLPALTNAAKDFVMQQLSRHEQVATGHVVIRQGSPDISKLYVLTSGAVAFFVDGEHKRTLAAPALFGELSVIYGTARTAEARVVEDSRDSSDPVLFTLDKGAWEEFMAMDIRHRTAAETSDSVETYTSSSDAKRECTIQLPNLDPVCRLGEGGFSTVTLAKDKASGAFFAMKTMDKSSIVKNALSKKVVTEKNLLERVAMSDFCLRLHGTFMTGDFIYILTEVAECGDLMEHMINLNIIPYVSARYYAACICLGISHCHDAKFVHRDVKPENCLVFASGRVKLGDFGLSKELPYSVDLGDGDRSICTLAFTMCGTPEFLAPEFIFSRGYDQRVDWWAFGCVLYEMLFAASPFVTNDLKTTFTRICDAASGKLPSNMREDLNQTDESASKFLRGLICNKESRLASSGNLTEITHHAYFEDFQWNQFREATMKPPPMPANKVASAKPDHTGFFQSDVSPFQGDDSEFSGFV